MPPRDRADTISAMCWDGKHGRCAGWMVVPNHGNKVDGPDISVRCMCRECNHPPVDPLHHTTHPPKVRPWSS